jgi:hypothetical protein
MCVPQVVRALSLDQQKIEDGVMEQAMALLKISPLITCPALLTTLSMEPCSHTTANHFITM